MKRLNRVVAGFGAGALASGAVGQVGSGGTVSQGSAVFRQQDSVTSSTHVSGYLTGADLRVTGAAGTDHCYQTGWWYRLSGDTREYTLANANLALTSWSGNLGVVHYDLPGFEAHVEYEVSEPAPGQGVLLHTLEITNIAGAPMRITVFHYLDYDLGATAAGDSAAITANPDVMRISEGATFGEYGGQGADAFLAGAFATVRSELTNSTVSSFASIGLPFGPGDWTAAWQWNEVEIAPGGIKTYTVVSTIGTPVVFPTVCYADCNGDGQLTVQDFGCFQTKFVTGDPYADCNGDGVATVQDFGCFQTKFVQGCP
jgi:hypothetical protein